jgi:hypothetical protein
LRLSFVIPSEPGASEATRDQREAIWLEAPPVAGVFAPIASIDSKQEFLKFSGKLAKTKILSEIREQKAVGRASVPAIAPVVEATCRSLESMAGTAARPTVVPAQHSVRTQ